MLQKGMYLPLPSFDNKIRDNNHSLSFCTISRVNCAGKIDMKHKVKELRAKYTIAISLIFY